jgi:hypothetical protein
MSATATWIMCIVIVGSLIGMLGVITLASRHPSFRNPRVPSMQGPVLGGMHLSEGGRSVAPTGQAPAELTENELRWIEGGEAGHPEAARPEQARPEQARPEVPVQPMPAVPAQRSAQTQEAVPQQAQGQSDQAQQAVPQQAQGQSDQAQQAVPRQRSGQADRSEKTTTDR